MSGTNGQLTPGPGAKIIPLMPGVARGFFVREFLACKFLTRKFLTHELHPLSSRRQALLSIYAAVQRGVPEQAPEARWQSGTSAHVQ